MAVEPLEVLHLAQRVLRVLATSAYRMTVSMLKSGVISRTVRPTTSLPDKPRGRLKGSVHLKEPVVDRSTG